ncbi:MAG: isoleucine--tRNA ligase [Coriobacteriales bacterium]|jgi:isoleucyl-tRNA synthetase|nr:isoleucine--tRNA ligase [Coriobacteriales bacterium]
MTEKEARPVAHDYKDTMNLPQTAFAMKANLAQNEPKRLEKWQQMGLYERMLEKNAGNPPYVLHDGPPYANGPIHIGHAFNKILKDIIVKYHTLRGFYTPYVPGWDCHGQPIEHMVEKKLGPAKMEAIETPVLRRLCREWAEKYVGIQREGFKRLGITGQWDDPYLTYTPAYEAGNVEVFKAMYDSGAIYRGRKPIHWCYHDHTALAEAELEYADVQSSSIYVAFALVEEDAPSAAANVPPAAAAAAGTAADGSAVAAGAAAGEADGATAVAAVPPVATAAAVPPAATAPAAPARLAELFPTALPVHVLIWTTTPWTLPANVAVTLAAQASYVVLLTADKALIVARELLAQVAEVLAIDEPVLLTNSSGEVLSYRGEQLLGLRYAHPVHADMTGVLITGAHVELTTGTGAVHTAPGHGQEDYQMGLEYDLPLLMPVDDNGVFDAGGGPFAGRVVDEANPEIIAWLAERGTLMAERQITHSYPHCWRCKQPVIFRATDQWFVSMEATELRAKALAQVEKLRWYPSWSVNRMKAMVEGRPDWCISRQRSWGVPIPVFKCAVCGSTVANDATFDAVAALFAREGADAWFTRAPAEYLPPGVVCEVCGCTELVPEKDILDVWWESGVSHTSVLKARENLSFPADLYLEGSDQHRGWFQSSLLTSVGSYGTAPYKAVMSCGFIVDGEGRKQSKSLGNVVDPERVIATYGADVLRLWVGSIDSSQDVGIDDEILKRSSEAYRRFRNSFRFLLSNLYDYHHQDALDWEQLYLQDRWALVRLRQVMAVVEDAYESNRFHLAYHALYDYLVGDLSAVYLDALKDRLYSDAPASPARRSAQTVLKHILEVLVRLLAPILSFTCDEVLEFYPEGLSVDKPEAAMLAGWPKDSDFRPPIPAGAAEPLLADFTVVLRAREAVTKALEEARAAKRIAKSQEARVELALAAADHAVLSELPAGVLEEIFIVSAVDLRERGAGDVVADAAVAGGGPATVADGALATGGGPATAADGAAADPTAAADVVAAAADPTAAADGAAAAADAILVTVLPAAGEKCPRCWNYRELGSDPDYPELCGRCAAVLRGLA